MLKHKWRWPTNLFSSMDALGFPMISRMTALEDSISGFSSAVLFWRVILSDAFMFTPPPHKLLMLFICMPASFYVMAPNQQFIHNVINFEQVLHILEWPSYCLVSSSVDFPWQLVDLTYIWRAGLCLHLLCEQVYLNECVLSIQEL